MIARDRPQEFPAMIEDNPLYRVRIYTPPLKEAHALNPTTKLSLDSYYLMRPESEGALRPILSRLLSTTSTRCLCWSTEEEPTF